MVKPVILFQDGAVDELVSVALLVSMPTDQVKFPYCSIINADCLSVPTYEVTVKLLSLLREFNPSLPTNISIYVDDSRGVNPFPWTYRQYSMMVNLLPALNTAASSNSCSFKSSEPPESFGVKNLSEFAAESDLKVSILCLGPLTPIAAMWRASPEQFQDAVEEIVWMGGAIPPAVGNIDPGLAIGANANAEWNAYWDPYAVSELFQSQVPFKMFPLNVTNSYPLDQNFFGNYIYPNMNYPMIDLIGQMYAMVAFEAGYCFWDSVTTSYFGAPELFSFETKNLTIQTDKFDLDFGSITESSSEGYPIQVAQMAKPVDAFYEYFVQQLKLISN